MSNEGQDHFFSIYFPGFVCVCFTRPRYQVSVYRTIGPLVQSWGHNKCFEVCCPETSSCASKPVLLRLKLVRPQCLYQVSLGLKEVQIGTNDFKLNMVPLFRSKTCEYQCFEACCPKTSSCASKPLLLRY